MMRLPLVRKMPRSRHQEGFLEERGKKRKYWYGHYYPYIKRADGTEKRTHRAIGFLGWKSELKKWEAEDALRKKIAEKGIEQKAPTVITFGWFTENKFLPVHEINWRPPTAYGNNYDINHYLFPILKEVPLVDIDKAMCAKLLKSLADKYAEPIVKRARVMLRAICAEAVDQDVIGKDPTRKLKLPACRVNPKPTLPKETAFKLIRAVTDVRDSLMLQLGVFCAPRPSEVFGFTWECYGGDSIRAENSAWEGLLQRGVAKTRKRKMTEIYIPEPLRPLFKAWRQMSYTGDDSGLIFPSEAGTPMLPGNWYKRRLYPIAKKLGIDTHLVNFQTLRRSCATRNRKRGNLKDIQEMLGHTTIGTTANEYIQPAPESVKAMMEADYADLMNPPKVQ